MSTNVGFMRGIMTCDTHPCSNTCHCWIYTSMIPQAVEAGTQISCISACHISEVVTVLCCEWFFHRHLSGQWLETEYHPLKQRLSMLLPKIRGLCFPSSTPLQCIHPLDPFISPHETWGQRTLTQICWYSRCWLDRDYRSPLFLTQKSCVFCQHPESSCSLLCSF